MGRRKGNKPTDTLMDRFNRLVERTPKCWIWIGSKLPTGYGTTEYRGRKLYGHRMSWEAHYGEIPAGMYVCHTCDNRSCVNPKHLFLGSQKDNMRDCRTKGRDCRGEKTPWSKLTERDVLTARRLYKSGKASQHALARKYGVNVTTMHSAIHGKQWKHLGGGG